MVGCIAINSLYMLLYDICYHVDYLSIHLSIHLPIYLPIYLSIYPSINLPIYLPVREDTSYIQYGMLLAIKVPSAKERYRRSIDVSSLIHLSIHLSIYPLIDTSNDRSI